MRNILAWGLVLVLAGNGLYMLLIPQDWYNAIPTVPGTGPFNPHFVRDIGCAYLTCAGAMAWFARNPVRAWPAALFGAIFLTAHAFTHLWDAAAGRAPVSHLAKDFVGVFLIPAAMLWLIWPHMRKADAPRPAA